MLALLRSLPNAVWWLTLFFAVLATFTQLAITVARSGSVALGRLLFEFILTLALLAIPVGIAWYARERRSVWHALGTLVLLVAFSRIFFL
jgi:hypothetical protein